MLELNNVSKKFPVKRGLFGVKGGSLVHAVDRINLKISPSETLGIVGESGCGKSTLVHLIIRLIQPTDGSITYQGRDLNHSSMSQKELSKQIQFVFQEAYSSLNPRMTIYDLLSEPIEIHGIAKGKEKNTRIFSLLDLIGLEKHHLLRYPHQLSAGQRQRVAFARALAIEPEFIILDEPVTGLDPSIKAQILNLLIDLKKIHKGFVIASHDLAMIKNISERVAVMYLGQIVEIADVDDLFNHPQHPYTEGLIAAIPRLDPKLREEKRILIQGEISTPIDPPSYCRFAKRCMYAKEICFQETPPNREINPSHSVLCFFPIKQRVITT